LNLFLHPLKGSTTMNTDIHPELKKEARLAALLGLVIVVAGVAAFGIAISFTWHGIVNQALGRWETTLVLA
jgi:hypothetical protein